nr:hypothetical protein [Candidatus Microthrix sp.]
MGELIHVAADATITARDLATGDVLGSRPYLDGSGSIELAGLPPASTSTVSLDVDGRPAGCVRLTTTPTLGPELSRFATLSDIHLGLDVFGLRGKIVESDPVREATGQAVAAPSTSGPPPWRSTN